MTGSFARLTVALGFAAALSACALHSPSVAELKYNPGRYQNKTVSVNGVVTSSWGVPLVPFKVYKIDDGTGSIWVLATDRGVPSKGSEVGVQGTIGSGINWKGRNYGLGMYEEKRRYGKR